WLRERGREGGMKAHVAFDFLEHLVDMTVEHSHGAKALQISQSAFAVARSPAPFGINRPERDVREDDNRRARPQTFHVAFQPFELLVAEVTKTAGFQVHHIYQSNKVDAVFVEAVPARTLRFDPLPVAFEILLAVIAEDIVLAGDIEDILHPAALQHLIEGVELL